jgi:uncharacterized RDD family membrane protein YckC/cytoskeletal protein CcmA (bactofilin family)
MNTNTLKPIRWWALVLCCVLLSAARAQDATDTLHGPPQAGKDAQAQTPEGQGVVPPPSSSASDEDDEGIPSDSSSPPAPPRHHHHRHRGGGQNAVVSIGHRADLSAGQHADSVVAVFGSATSAGEVDNSVVSVLGNTRVIGGKVGDSAVAVMGSVYVNTEVEGDVVAVLGNVELGPEARVRGDVVIVGGELTRDPAATIDGHLQTVFSTDWSNFDWLKPWVERCLLYGRPLAFAPGLGWAWGIALGLLALYVFIAFLFRTGVERCVQTLETRPGQSIVAALLTMLLTPVLCVLLCITIIGIAAIPFLAIALFGAAIFGKVVVLAFIGRRCTPMLAKDPLVHTVVGVLVGGAIVLVLYTIPVVGFIVYKLLGILGLGVVVYTLLLALRSGRQARAEAQGPAPGVGPGAGGGGGPGGGPGPGSGIGPGVSAGPDVGPGPGVGSGLGASAASNGPTLGDFAASPDPSPGGHTPSSGPNTTPGAVGPASASVASLPRAGFAIRMAALLLDTLLIGILLQVHPGARLELLVLAAYGAVMWKLKGSTIGGIICGLQVMRIDGRPIDWSTAIVRALSCFLSLAVVGLGFLWIAIDSEGQAWHDKIAGTVVVRAPKGTSLL